MAVKCVHIVLLGSKKNPQHPSCLPEQQFGAVYCGILSIPLYLQRLRHIHRDTKIQFTHCDRWVAAWVTVVYLSIYTDPQQWDTHTPFNKLHQILLWIIWYHLSKNKKGSLRYQILKLVSSKFLSPVGLTFVVVSIQWIFSTPNWGMTSTMAVFFSILYRDQINLYLKIQSWHFWRKSTRLLVFFRPLQVKL